MTYGTRILSESTYSIRTIFFVSKMCNAPNTLSMSYQRSKYLLNALYKINSNVVIINTFSKYIDITHVNEFVIECM